MRSARWKNLLLFSVLSFAAGACAPAADGTLAEEDDLVVFDTAPVQADPAEIVELEDVVTQSAFPVFYGEMAATVRTPEPPEPAERLAEPPVEVGLALGSAVPLPPPAELLDEGTAALPAGAPAALPVPSILPDRESPPPLPELAAQPEPSIPSEPVPIGDVYSPPALPKTIEDVRAEFNALKTYCEADSLGSAAEIYARMPDFSGDDEMNRLRADAANLLILGLARGGNLDAARRVYDSVPAEMSGFDARLAKARAVINLATYLIRARRYTDAFAVLMDAGKIQNRSALNNELFRLMARMIPYLDNAEETEKAQRIYDLLLSEVKSPGTAALFAENVRASVLTYYFHYVDNSDSPVHRRRRLDFLEHVFFSLESLAENTDVRALRSTLGAGLAERYAGDPERAAQFNVDI